MPVETIDACVTEAVLAELENAQRYLRRLGQEGCDWTVYDCLVSMVRRLLERNGELGAEVARLRTASALLDVELAAMRRLEGGK